MAQLVSALVTLVTTEKNCFQESCNCKAIKTVRMSTFICQRGPYCRARQPYVQCAKYLLTV